MPIKSKREHTRRKTSSVGDILLVTLANLISKPLAIQVLPINNQAIRVFTFNQSN